MKRFRLHRQLWLIGLLSWFLVGRVAVTLLPAETGPFSERPVARAILIGGAVGLPLMVTTLIRSPRRLWLWGLCVWGVILLWSARSGAFGDDSDIDQILGWGIGLGGLAGVPLIVFSAARWLVAEVRRATKERSRKWRVDVTGKALTITRRGDSD